MPLTAFRRKASNDLDALDVADLIEGFTRREYRFPGDVVEAMADPAEALPSRVDNPRHWPPMHRHVAV